MRIQKTIKIDDREITVKELLLIDYFTIFDLNLDGDLSLKGIRAHIEKVLPLATDLPFDVFLKMAPSEADVIWEAFKEVNSSFLAKIRKLGLGKIWEKIQSMIVKDFLELFAVSFKPDITMPLSTVSPSSGLRSRNLKGKKSSV